MAHIYNSQLDAFTLYHTIQEAGRDSTSFFSPDGTALPALGHAIAGSTGAAVSNLCTYPLDLIITRLQIQRKLRKDPSNPSEVEYAGLRDAAQKIYENEGGLAGFYAGVLQDTCKTIADAFFFFLAYNFLRQRRIAGRGSSSSKPLPAVDELAVGFLAGSFTKLLTTPIANIVTRKQASAMTSAPSSQETPITEEEKAKGLKSRDSTSEIAREIMEQKGLLGFWSGYSASLMLTLNPSLTFFLFETFKRLLPRSRRNNPPPLATFLMAAFSKACASTVTYPFNLAKSRAQAGDKNEEKGTPEETKQEIKDASDSVLSGSRAERMAAQGTIFGTLLHIAETEGVHGLYDGLYLEIAKGFFSHGITMIVKQGTHKLIVQAYYILSIVVSQYRKKANPEQLAQAARQQSYEYYDLARARAEERLAATKVALQSAQKQVAEMTDGLKEATKIVIDKANETAELVADYVEEEAEEWRSLYGTGLSRWLEEK